MDTVSGNLFVIAAPSGAGKTSLVKALSETVMGLQISVSHTTRAMRLGEEDGHDYFFISHHDFQHMIEKHVFLEHATVFGNEYGTSRHWVNEQLARGVDVVLEIDWQGARQIKMLYPGVTLIFILPPSMETLKKRLENRRQDDIATIANRMLVAQDDIGHFHEFDFLVINDRFDVALCDLQHIMQSARLKTSIQSKKQVYLLENLLKKL